jgi:hypothetical protein
MALRDLLRRLEAVEAVEPATEDPEDELSRLRAAEALSRLRPVPDEVWTAVRAHLAKAAQFPRWRINDNGTRGVHVQHRRHLLAGAHLLAPFLEVDEEPTTHTTHIEESPCPTA